MTTATQTKISYDEFLEWTGEDQNVEWVNGEVVAMIPVSNRHEDVSGFLKPLLRHFVEAHHLGVIRGEPFQLKTAPNLPGRSPDMFFVANANLPRIKKTFLDGPPIWLSRSSALKAGRGTGAISFTSMNRAAFSNTG
jgi:Uma2 family endonuclease